jgi:hypothetical protein
MNNAQHLVLNYQVLKEKEPGRNKGNRKRTWSCSQITRLSDRLGNDYVLENRLQDRELY